MGVQHFFKGRIDFDTFSRVIAGMVNPSHRCEPDPDVRESDVDHKWSASMRIFDGRIVTGHHMECLLFPYGLTFSIIQATTWDFMGSDGPPPGAGFTWPVAHQRLFAADALTG